MNHRTARHLTLAAFALATRGYAQTSRDAEHNAGRDPEREAERSGLLAQATRARDHDHDHTRALSLAEQAGAIRMTVTLRQFIAEEHESLGHLAGAVAAARDCVADAARDEGAHGRDQALRECRAIERRIAPRVATVVITAPSPVPEGLRVTLDDHEVAATLWGREIPVDPGLQRVDATTATGHFAQSETLRAGGRAEFRVVITSLVTTPPFEEHHTITPPVVPPPVVPPPVVPPTVVPPPPDGDAIGTRPDVPPPTPRAVSHGPGAGPWILGGIGLAALGGAVVTYVLADSARSEAAMYCSENPATLVRDCQDQRGVDAADRRNTLQIVNNVLLFGGIGIVAGAATWYVIGRVTGEHRSARGWDLQVTPTSGGAVVGVSGVM